MKPQIETARKTLALAIFAAASLMASSCGTDAEASVASLNNSDDNTDSGSETNEGEAEADEQAPQSPEDAIAAFTDCMAENGITLGISVTGDSSGGGVILSEPDDNALGAGDVDPQNDGGSYKDFGPEAYAEANEACEGLLSNIDNGFDATPEQEAAFKDAQLEWSDCMLDQGVDVPELGGPFGGGSIIIEGTSDGADPQSGDISFEDLDFDFEAFEDASEICQSVYEQYGELDGLFEQNQTTE